MSLRLWRGIVCLPNRIPGGRAWVCAATTYFRDRDGGSAVYVWNRVWRQPPCQSDWVVAWAQSFRGAFVCTGRGSRPADDFCHRHGDFVPGVDTGLLYSIKQKEA